MSNNSSSISLTEEKDIIYSGFKLHKNGLQAIGTPTFEQWQECGEFIKKSTSAIQWWRGDWLNYGERTYKEWTQEFSEDNTAYQTLRNEKYVASKIDLSRRRDIPWSVQAEVAPFEPKEQEKLLDMAEKTKATVKQIRKEKHRALIDINRPKIKLDDHLINGDSLWELQTIPDQSIDCVITDPPYGIDYQSNRREVKEQLDKIKNDKDEAFGLLDGVCKILVNKMKPNSHLYFFTSWKVYSRFEGVISKYFEIKNVIVWDKLNHGTGDLEGNYGEQHELIIFASNGRRILNGDRPTNIIAYSRVSNNLHPTEKPVGLLKRLIEVSTQEGETVLDPFMGVGSTCVASKEVNRNYWGIELDKQWFDVAQERINNGEK